MTLEYVESFPALLLRRAPDGSRPPANFERTLPQRLLRRVAAAARAAGVRAPAAAGAAAARHARALRRRARAREAGPAGRAARGRSAPGESPRLDVAARPPAGWNENGVPGTVTPGTPGDSSGRVNVDGGRYRLWVRGGSGRALTVSVDGRAAGRVVGRQHARPVAVRGRAAAGARRAPPRPAAPRRRPRPRRRLRGRDRAGGARAGRRDSSWSAFRHGARRRRSAAAAWDWIERVG